MATITTSAGLLDVVVTEPVAVLDYGYQRGSRNVVLEPLGASHPTVFLRPAQTRSGTLRLLFSSVAAAEEAQEALASANRHHFDAPEADQEFDFIVSGNITVAKVEGVDYWTLDVDFREVETL
jgi:hypothetical protein